MADLEPLSAKGVEARQRMPVSKIRHQVNSPEIVDSKNTKNDKKDFYLFMLVLCATGMTVGILLSGNGTKWWRRRPGSYDCVCECVRALLHTGNNDLTLSFFTGGDGRAVIVTLSLFLTGECAWHGKGGIGNYAMACVCAYVVLLNLFFYTGDENAMEDTTDFVGDASNDNDNDVALADEPLVVPPPPVIRRRTQRRPQVATRRSSRARRAPERFGEWVDITKVDFRKIR